MLVTALAGFVRGLNPLNYAEGDDKKVSINTRGDLCVAQALPPKAEIVRMGQSWQVSIATGSAFTHVAAWPTTRAEIVLFNNEPDGGKSYIIDSAWAANVATSIAAASAYTLIGQIALARHASPTIAALTDDTAQLITSKSGKLKYAGNAIKAVANTAFAIASKWEVLAAAPAGAAGSIGLAVFADIQGGLIVPPGECLCLNLVVGTATGTASIGVSWHEMQIVRG